MSELVPKHREIPEEGPESGSDKAAFNLPSGGVRVPISGHFVQDIYQGHEVVNGAKVTDQIRLNSFRGPVTSASNPNPDVKKLVKMKPGRSHVENPYGEPIRRHVFKGLKVGKKESISEALSKAKSAGLPADKMIALRKLRTKKLNEAKPEGKVTFLRECRYLRDDIRDYTRHHQLRKAKVMPYGYWNVVNPNARWADESPFERVKRAGTILGSHLTGNERSEILKELQKDDEISRLHAAEKLVYLNSAKIADAITSATANTDIRELLVFELFPRLRDDALEHVVPGSKKLLTSDDINKTARELYDARPLNPESVMKRFPKNDHPHRSIIKTLNKIKLVKKGPPFAFSYYEDTEDPNYPDGKVINYPESDNRWRNDILKRIRLAEAAGFKLKSVPDGIEGLVRKWDMIVSYEEMNDDLETQGKCDVAIYQLLDPIDNELRALSARTVKKQKLHFHKGGIKESPSVLKPATTNLEEMSEGERAIAAQVIIYKVVMGGLKKSEARGESISLLPGGSQELEKWMKRIDRISVKVGRDEGGRNLIAQAMAEKLDKIYDKLFS